MKILYKKKNSKACEGKYCPPLWRKWRSSSLVVHYPVERDLIKSKGVVLCQWCCGAYRPMFVFENHGVVILPPVLQLPGYEIGWWTWGLVLPWVCEILETMGWWSYLLCSNYSAARLGGDHKVWCSHMFHGQLFVVWKHGVVILPFVLQWPGCGIGWWS